jgi:hypothetical protein
VVTNSVLQAFICGDGDLTTVRRVSSRHEITANQKANLPEVEGVSVDALECMRLLFLYRLLEGTNVLIASNFNREGSAVIVANDPAIELEGAGHDVRGKWIGLSDATPRRDVRNRGVRISCTSTELVYCGNEVKASRLHDEVKVNSRKRVNGKRLSRVVCQRWRRNVDKIAAV